jgi:hypothetical protein
MIIPCIVCTTLGLDFFQRLCSLERAQRTGERWSDFDGEMGPLRPKWRSFLVYCVVKTDGWLGPTPQGPKGNGGLFWFIV